ncbi:MAG: hypothetical protein ABI551_21200, partial [Polyangiaceae bacterium]
IPRAVLRVAHQIGLMPTLAASQTMFARTLAAALRERSDVRVEDAELTAWAMTNMTMGIIHTRIWHDDAPFSDDVLKAEITTTPVGVRISRAPSRWTRSRRSLAGACLLA